MRAATVVQQLCNSCASLAGLVLSFIACFILFVIAPLVQTRAHQCVNWAWKSRIQIADARRRKCGAASSRCFVHTPANCQRLHARPPSALTPCLKVPPSAASSVGPQWSGFQYPASTSRLGHYRRQCTRRTRWMWDWLKGVVERRVCYPSKTVATWLWLWLITK